MPLSSDNLEELVGQLARRPGHETVRVQLGRLLIDGLGARSEDILQEERIEARSRVDTLLGDTVFEIKSDLRNERSEAERQLARYLERRERDTGRRFTGVATDGLDYLAFELRDGGLTGLGEFRASSTSPRDLLVWLESIASVSPDLPCDALTITRELGRDSAAFARAKGILARAWASVADSSEARLKRQLWADLLAIVYGGSQDEDALWFQHTYLTIVAKAFAHALLRIGPESAEDLLSGRVLHEAGIHGAIESDFFDWILSAPEGADLIDRLANRVRRFRLEEVDIDFLKILYESLIDPEQRHDLGEYYTPDWLAERMCRAAIDSPLTQRILDPACGSGTFLFHAIRAIKRAARARQWSPSDTLLRCTGNVLGMDVHPVAVIIARVTYLLALGEELLRERVTDVSVPVYLGDALQWGVRATLGHDEIVIRIPPANDDGDPSALEFPVGVAERPALYDDVIAKMIELSEQRATAQAAETAIAQLGDISEADLGTLKHAYSELRRLKENGRNHVWGYFARNVARPLWLSRPDQRPHRVIGNPPWLSLRYMASAMQRRVREGMDEYHIWVGGKSATHQDLSGYFFARCVDLYLNEGGKIAFLMPFAALSRAQFEEFRTGEFDGVKVAFAEPWTFDERVAPLFNIPSCAVFAVRSEHAEPFPETVLGFAGLLSHKNASLEEASQRLREVHESFPAGASFQEGTPYRRAFRQGATLVPRMLCYVERRETGVLGTGARIPVVSRRSTQENPPWKDLPSVRGAVERQFLRPALLGESIAPYRIFEWPEAVIPFAGHVLDARAARSLGFAGLAGWLEKAEEQWNRHSNQNRTFREQIDYWGKLGSQFPTQPIRVLYTASGTQPASAILEHDRAVLEHKLYWSSVETREEALYLCAILNSETARAAVEHLQSRGQWGARDFDKVMFTLPIPRYSNATGLHADLVGASHRAERTAASVDIPEGTNTTRARRAIREALRDDGVADEIDGLVRRLLFGEQSPRSGRCP